MHDLQLAILDDVPEVLAELTVKDASDIESLGHENPYGTIPWQFNIHQG